MIGIRNTGDFCIVHSVKVCMGNYSRMTARLKSLAYSEPAILLLCNHLPQNTYHWPEIGHWK